MKKLVFYVLLYLYISWLHTFPSFHLRKCVFWDKLDVLIFFSHASHKTTFIVQDNHIWVIDVLYKKFIYRAKTMIYVKVVLKIRYDPRVKRLSKSHKKSFKFPPFFCVVYIKEKSMQKNMVKKKRNCGSFILWTKKSRAEKIQNNRYILNLHSMKYKSFLNVT